VWDKYHQSTFTPEALYYFGVAKYLESHKVEALVEGWQLLQRYHPQSSWGIRTAVVTSSTNAEKALERAGIAELFDAKVDGNVAAELE
jgi:beta-phosphoglucomutase-like phosphatase (HAD superfamily)